MEESIERASKGSNEQEGPSEEATLEFFDAMSNHGNAEENGVIDAAQECKKLQEGNENLEFFDAKSDHGENGVNEMIGAQSSNGKVLVEVSSKPNRLQEQLPSNVSDDQTGISKGCEAEDSQLFEEQPQVKWPSEITRTPSTSIAASPPLEHQTETLKHAEQGSPSTSEAEKNENTKTTLDIICSPNSQTQGHRGRGRPRKLRQRCFLHLLKIVTSNIWNRMLKTERHLTEIRVMAHMMLISSNSSCREVRGEVGEGLEQ